MAVNILMGAQPLAIAVLATFGQRLSVYVGTAPLTPGHAKRGLQHCNCALTQSGGWAVSCSVIGHGPPVTVPRCAGRVQVLLALRLLGWVSMGIMAFTSLWRTPWLIVSIFLLRTAVNNSGYPVQKSVLMDHVPKVAPFSAADHMCCWASSTPAVLDMVICLCKMQ